MPTGNRCKIAGMKREYYYETILIGAGAGGLFFGAACPALGEVSGKGFEEASGANCGFCSGENSGAICAAGGGQRLLILEKTSRVGTKLLMSGAGQCNITHGGSIKDFLSHYGDGGKQIRTLLYRHNNSELVDFMQELGVRCAEREDGKVFPSSLSAAEVRQALLRRCQQNGVKIQRGAEVVAILPLCGTAVLDKEGAGSAECFEAGETDGFEADSCGLNKAMNSAATSGVGGRASGGGFEAGSCGLNKAMDSVATSGVGGRASGDGAGETGFHGGAGARFRLLTSGGESYTCSNLVVAAGGASYPTTGSDGSLLQVLRRDLPKLGVTPLRPALTPVFVENYPFAALSGMGFHDVEIKIFESKTKKSRKLPHPCGDLLLTHKNFSGPVILNNSRYIFAGCGLEINFVFPYTVTDMISQMKRDFPKNHRRISTYIGETYVLPKKFVAEVLAHAGIEDKPASGLSGKEITQAAERFARARFSVSGTGGFGTAMATAGGVSLDSVSLSDMQSKPYPGLYFIGEVLDIDGDTGGYNLQLAYSTARTAAENIFLAK